MTYQLFQGNCLERLRDLPDGSVNCAVTSPPYYGLRDYGHDGQIGLEETPEQYIAKMVMVMREVRRVLRDDGTLWLNLGDSYASGTKGSGGGWANDPTNYAYQAQAYGARKYNTGGLADKQLMGIPWRVAFALQADGWYLRQDIIWHKPNPMPESVADRCTRAHEYIFLLAKSARYWYDAEAVKEQSLSPGPRIAKDDEPTRHGTAGARASGVSRLGATSTRNKRSVWTVATQAYSGAHFATYPPDLIEPCILAGCPAQCCPKCGKGWERVVEVERHRARLRATEQHAANANRTPQGGYRGEKETRTIGHRPACDCGNPDSVPGVVLDPFTGSGTTGEVALLNNRNFIGVELNPEYIELAHQRIGAAEIVAKNKRGEFTRTQQEIAAGQLALFGG